ncbi:hypothetical protein LDA44_06515, partial [Enterococcus faecium]|nr:hypothetical protein [Enterococcus faecium]MCH3301849.1 hypothetical protein [Enterococcus faecium]MCH3303844.1 hypothetical protein [Enterococcus faecium]
DQEELIHLISNYSKISLYQHHLTKSQNLSQNVVHSDSDLILHNSSVLIDKEPVFVTVPYSE